MRFAALSSYAVLALAAGAAVFAPEAPVSAAPSVSPFAGSYSGYLPVQLTEGPWSFRISNRGQVSGSYSGGGRDAAGQLVRNRGKLTGAISEAGDLSASVTMAWDGYWATDYFGGSYYVPPESLSFSFNATASVLPDGDLSVATTLGSPYVWTRQ
jgi:hypothetical protein